MQPIDIVNQYYLKFGNNEAACAKEYLQNNIKMQINRGIRKIAVYWTLLRYGGVGRVISLMLPIYESMNCEVVLITEDISAEDYKIPGTVKRFTIVNSEDIATGRKSYRERAEEMAHIFMQEKIDVFVHHGTIFPFLVYDIMLAKLMGIYTIGERHQVFTEEFCRMHDLFFKQVEIFKMLDKLVVLSNTDVLYWNSLGIDACYIENPSNTSVNGIRHNSQSKNIVWVGRLDIVQKQYLDVLDIAREVIKRKACARFLIYGNGADKEVEQLNRAIRLNGLAENVFYCGYQTDVSQIYENARIHLVTSAFESFGMGIYESRICGIPLVMYELPYLELLKEKKGYLAADNGDIYAMAENICRILEDQELDKALQIGAKESVRDFNNDIVCDKWKSLFSEIEQGRKEIKGNEEYEIILRTMHKHFSIAQKRYNDLHLDFKRFRRQEQIVFNVIKGVMKGKQIVLCPYGKVGNRVKELINEKGIYEAYIIDNAISENDKQIKSFEEIRNMDCSNMFFVICSKQRHIRQLFYEEIRKLTSEENIVFFDDGVN